MSDKEKASELEDRLREAEEILEALRSHKVDAVIGSNQVAMLRLQEVEDKLQKQIQISGNRLNEIVTIYQSVPVGLCTLDRELKFVRVNEHLAKLNGISVEAHIGHTIMELLPKLTKTIEPDLRRLLVSGEPKMNVELWGETPAHPETERCFVAHWMPLNNKKNEIIGINMVIEEITEQKQFAEELNQLNVTLEERVAERTMVAEQRAEKLRKMALQMTQVEEKERQRLARILHDGLQQLLIGAKFNTKLIKKRLPEENDVTEEIHQLEKILDQSIESSRSLSYELSPPILHDNDLSAALHWLAEMRHMHGLSISIEIINELPPLSQNLKVFLFQAVRELLINIIKHAEVEKATVKASYEEPNISLEVIDHGKGFDSKKLQNNTSNSLGLPNIQKKLDLLNGDLKIDSEPGKGSHFKLIVPVNSSSDSDRTEEPAQKIYNSSPLSKKTHTEGASEASDSAISVLVVDDHQVMRDGLVSLLSEESDINIIGEANNGREAVEFVRNHHPDVIIMDITMPEMNGIEATHQIHREFPDVNIIGLSMHEEEEYAIKMKEAGAVNLLNKGGPAEQLFDSVRNIHNWNEQ
ncbi:MAG: response regulator [Balneolaceae bacterium]